MSIKSFFASIFGSSSPRAELSVRPQTQRRNSARDSKLSHSILTVESLDFVGQASGSPNKRWVVGRTDRLPGMNPRKGEFDGSAVLVDYAEDRVVVRIDKLWRPQDSAVSDAGIFLVNDANWGERLSGDLQAVDATGLQLCTRKYTANVFNLAISKCGRYGVAQTANAPNDDGNLLELFDLKAGTVLFSRAPESGWADGYAFAVEDSGVLKWLTVIHKDVGRFNYSPSGEFLERAAHQNARLTKGDPEMRIYAAKTALKGDPENRELAAQLLDVLDVALKELNKDRTDYLSSGLRVKGEALELLGRTDEAVSAYEEAVAVNPKVGVAKRLTALKKVSAKAGAATPSKKSPPGTPAS